MTAFAITTTGPEKVALLPIETLQSLGSDEVRGPTLATLVSPGTEISWNYLGQGGEFPNFPGYAAVFEANEIGSDVIGIKPGDRLYCMGWHRSVQQHKACNVVPIPDILPSQEALLTRLIGVSMTTLMTTKARPGDLVLVTGLGPIGYLCAHLFKISGYEVHAVNRGVKRQRYAKLSGIINVSGSVPIGERVNGKVALAIDCSGNEQAIIDSARSVRKGGEVVLVGVPWERHTNLTAHELLDVVFHNYVILRSGWEWELPHHEIDFLPYSIYSGFNLAMRWLAEGRVPVQGLISLHRPENSQIVYQDLLHRREKGLFQVFDWQK